jgi:DNA-binding NarL/FixJ family response regulator
MAENMSDALPIRIALVEDQPEHSRTLQCLLAPAAGFECVANCSSAEEALRLLPSLPLDVAVMDIHLGEMSGIECVWRLKEIQPGFPIIICTALESDDLILEAIAAGASGYVLKHDSGELIQTAIRNVARGCLFMSRPVARDLQHFFRAMDGHQDETIRLSRREQEVLKEIAQGYMDTEIVCHLKIEAPTLRTHIHNVFEKLHVGTRTEAAASYWQSRQGRFHRLSTLVRTMRHAAQKKQKTSGIPQPDSASDDRC